MAASVGSAMRGEHIVCLPLQLLHQPGESTVMAAVPAGSEVALCKVMLWLLRQPGRENKRVCSSHGSSSLLSVSQLTPCLPWVQRTVRTV